METKNNVPTLSSDRFINLVLGTLNNPVPILVYCNDLKKITSALVKVTDSNDCELLHQQGPIDPIEGLKDTLLYEYYKDQYFINKDRNLLARGIDKLYNISSGSELKVVMGYPNMSGFLTDKKMILLLENFNFWDTNSQTYLAGLSERHKNIIPVCQIRPDFDFASNNIDIGLRTGKYGAIHLILE